ncbi:MAG: Zn-dependent hydrolase [Synergistaceae bacterium]|nr:Zn-dependent hydrolase [Synergistaceae bacterium]
MLEAKTERIKQDLEAMGKFTATPGAGMTRFSFTEEHRLTRDYIAARMKEAGLAVHEDSAGNLFGRREGAEAGAKAIMIGSHFDSVKSGGIFDGPAGVVMGLEVARILHEEGVKTRYPLEFAALIEEEGARFGGGLHGSRVMTGTVSREMLDDFKDRDGTTMAEAMSNFGLNPDDIASSVRPEGSLKAFIEMHIEQGPILENEGIELGLVKTIVGISQKEIEILGRADHAGTTPMEMRCNALTAAAEAALFLDEAAKKAGGGTVATVGRMEVYPGGINIVPARVFFTVDVRAGDMARIEQVTEAFGGFLKDLEKRGLKVRVTDRINVPPVKLSPEILDVFAAEAKKRGYSTKTMLSGAGHDAMIMASATAAGLLFVPSRGGRSHCPEEWTDYEEIKKGVDVVLGAVMALAEATI